VSRRTSLRAALLLASAACAVSALPASALAAGPQLDEPVPGSVIVQANGLEWVWASPCAQNGCTSGIRVGKDGFSFATADQWALRPAVTDFGETKCAAPWFDETYDHCDYTDPDVDSFGSAPTDGQPAGADGLQAMSGSGETWLVRVAPATPTGFAPTSPSSSNTPSVTGTAAPGSTVRLYTTSVCTGTAAATGSAAEFADPGLSVTVGSDQTTTFYATATNASSETSACSAGLEYVEDSTAPAAPTFDGTAPASPSSDNAPKLKGTADADTTVRIHTSSDCTGTAVASGSPAQFADPGLEVTVPDDSDTELSASSTDAAGNVTCSATTVHYVEDSSVAAPTLSSTSPASPANDNRPKIAGSAEAGSAVQIYATADCTGAVAASGGAATLASPGLEVSVADDSQTTFTAVTTDAAGNRSACSAPITYTERTTPDATPRVVDRLAPVSTIAAVTRSQRRSRRVTLSGTAGGTGSAVQVVRVSVARVVGKLCRFLQEDGTFSARRSCARTTYLTATGQDTWSLALRKLPKGSYKVRSRAIDAAGNVERKDASRNLLRFRL
jgi:hypothetical protein